MSLTEVLGRVLGFSVLRILCLCGCDVGIVGGVAVTVSNFSSYKGDAVTGSLTHRVNCVCVSDNTVCQTMALCDVRGNVFRNSHVSTRGLGDLVGSVRVSFHLGPRAKHPSACLGKMGMRGGVHAVRISSHIDPVTALSFMHRTVITRRRRVNGTGNVIVSKHSVNAAIFPSTRLGVFMATAPRVQTRHHCSRLGTGKRRTDFSRVLRGIGRQSCVSRGQSMDPLHGTSSTLLLSGDRLDVSRRGR